MRLPDKDRVLSFAVVLALAAILVVLAVLQYRWSGQVSEAASERMKANLQTAMLHFRDGLAHEFGSIALSFQLDSESTAPAAYARQIEQWKQTTAYPELIANVYVWKANGKQSRFERLNFRTLQFEACAGPAGFEKLTEPLQEFASRAAASREKAAQDVPLLARSMGPVPRRIPGQHGPPRDGVAAPPATELAKAAPFPGSAEPGAESVRTQVAQSVPADQKPERQLASNEHAASSDTQETAAAVRQEEAPLEPRPGWTRGSRTGGWAFSSTGPAGRPRSARQPGFSAFGWATDRQAPSQANSAPMRRQVLAPSHPGMGVGSSDANSLFNRPFIVPDPPLARREPDFEKSPVPAQQHGAPPAPPVDFLEGRRAELEGTVSPASGSANLRGPVRPIAGAPSSAQPGPPRVRFAPWFVEPSIPALLRPQFAPRHGVGDEGRGFPQGDWIVIELNRKVLQEHVFPELVERYFSGPEGLIYDIAVRGDTQNGLIYSSGSGLEKGSSTAADAQLGLFGSPGGPSGPMRVFFAGDHPPQDGPPNDGPRWARRRMGGPILMPFQGGVAEGWELLARHRKGSLEAAVAGMRRRNLGISFGVLLILGVTMAMVVVTARRAQRLATLQMDFVAGVSHELRTPLAVISSAADNIADGIVSDKTRLTRYGKLIRDHSRQLTELVEQILSFAAARQQSQHYNLVRVQPAEFVDAALRNSGEMIRNAGFTLEQQIQPNLPEVVVDVPAATRCLQNLISNAVKYGGEQHWIGVRARANDGEIQISVEDKGIGMEPEDLRRVFQPFYRAPGVVAAQIHGTGLGLALAKTMAEAFGGRLTATSKPGKGSTFVLHLPPAEGATTEAANAPDSSPYLR